MKIYIAGPMTGLPNFGFPAFNAAAAYWRELGYEVLNPAETDDGGVEQTRAWYLRRAFALLIQCVAVVVLPDWDKSAGARCEVLMAQEMDMPIWRHHDGLVVKSKVEASVHLVPEEEQNAQ